MTLTKYKIIMRSGKEHLVLHDDSKGKPLWDIIFNNLVPVIDFEIGRGDCTGEIISIRPEEVESIIKFKGAFK